MGEWGVIKLNITNMDCLARVSDDFEFKGIPDEVLKGIESRAQEMLESDLIKGYNVSIEYSYGYGGEVYHDAKLSIIGACSGRSIKIYHALIWFAWKKYPGRDLGVKSDVNKELKAFDPIEYILEGSSPGSSTIIEFKLFIPPDILPEERTMRPYLDIRVHYPGWIDYTLEQRPTSGAFEIKPYRSFNLTITDYGGLNPIAGARVVIRRLMHYYEVREYITPENGTIRIHRLKEDDYEIRIYWNSSSYLQESPLIHMGIHSAYDLASSKNLKTLVFNVRINALDRRERPLSGARVVLDGVEEIAEGGLTLFQLVPNGNHSLQIYWRNVKLLDRWIWIGYHPTIAPKIKKPDFRFTLPVDDLIIQAVDSGGNPIGAEFKIRDPEGLLPEIESYSRTGFLNISQLPVKDYLVEARNCSKVFKSCAEASEVYKPGGTNTIALPIHSVKILAYSISGKALENATILLGPAAAKTNSEGSALFAGIPEGVYPIKILWRKIEVHSGTISVEKSIEKKIICPVYDVRIVLRTADDKPIEARWILEDPSGKIYDSMLPEDTIAVDLIPEGVCRLTILGADNSTLINEAISAKDLSEMEVLKLPIADLRVKVLWSDGLPIAGAKLILTSLLDNRSYSMMADQRGEAVFHNMRFADYLLEVRYPNAPFSIARENITFEGGVAEVRAKQAQVAVKVLDWFGNPLKNAVVKISMSGVVFSEMDSGSDGVVVFRRLPYLAAYQVDVRYGPLKVRNYAYPGQVLIVKLEVIKLFGLTIYISEILAAIPYIIAAVVICAAVAAILILRSIARRRYQ